MICINYTFLGTLFGKPVSGGADSSSVGPAYLSNTDSAATFGALASTGASIFGGQAGVVLALFLYFLVSVTRYDISYM